MNNTKAINELANKFANYYTSTSASKNTYVRPNNSVCFSLNEESNTVNVIIRNYKNGFTNEIVKMGEFIERLSTKSKITIESVKSEGNDIIFTFKYTYK